MLTRPPPVKMAARKLNQTVWRAGHPETPLAVKAQIQLPAQMEFRPRTNRHWPGTIHRVSRVAAINGRQIIIRQDSKIIPAKLERTGSHQADRTAANKLPMAAARATR